MKEKEKDMENAAAERSCCCGSESPEPESKEETDAEGCCGKKRARTPEEYKALENRLNRIEGQVRGVKRMLDSDAYCTDILIQVAAISSALSSFSRVLLDNHIRTCVARDIREGREETVDELMGTLSKLIR